MADFCWTIKARNSQEADEWMREWLSKMIIDRSRPAGAETEENGRRYTALDRREICPEGIHF